MIKSVLAACAAFALVSCASAPQPAPNPPVAVLPAMTPVGSITLFEGGCGPYASCTTYEIVVRPDGGYDLNGRQRTRTAGATTGALGPAAFAAAEAALARADFAAMPEAMNGSDPKVWRPDREPCMLHAPIMQIKRDTGDGQSKTVYWYIGCDSAKNSALLKELRAAFQFDALVKPPE